MEHGLVTTQKTPASNSSMPTEHEMMVYQTMATQAVESKMYKGIGDQAGVMMIMLAARELGIPPMQALNGGINIIQGKAEISARMMSALIRKAGHRLAVKECTEQHCILVGQRADTGDTQTASFSVEEAKAAGLVKPGGGWSKWPKDMCFARALSRLARQLFSDVIGIGYVEGEISKSQDVKCETNILEDVSEVVMSEEDIEKNKQNTIDRFVALFDKKDKYLSMQYVDAVEKHFECTTVEAINKLMKDEPKLFDKFNGWKAKNKKTEEAG